VYPPPVLMPLYATERPQRRRRSSSGRKRSSGLGGGRMMETIREGRGE